MSRIVSESSARSLESLARKIVETFRGHWKNHKGMCRCPSHNDQTPSLAVSVGRNAILFYCFAGCSYSQVIAAFGRHGISARDLFSGNSDARLTPPRMNGTPSPNALRLWNEAKFLRDTPARCYLHGRSITAMSSQLRYHARTPLGPSGQVHFLPAMIAAVRTDVGIIAIHRTFLDIQRGKKAAFAKPKRALGSLGAGAVRLFDAESGTLGLAEGIESALSAKALTGIPCWATLGNERFGSVAIPDSVTQLYLFIDADAGGELAAERGLAAYAKDGRDIYIRKPTILGQDWNDVLKAKYGPVKINSA